MLFIVFYRRDEIREKKTEVEFVDFHSSRECEEYENFVNNHSEGSFTQSLHWCKVKQGWLHEAIIIRNDYHEIIAAMLILIKKIPLLHTAYMYAPRGPVCDYKNEPVLRKLQEGITVLAKKYHASIFKCDPFIKAQDTDTIHILNQAGFIHQKGIQTIQCTDNYVLDIQNKSMDEIFASFHNKWRYNIKLAEKKGVVCEYYEKCSEDKINEFYELMEETGKRDGFFNSSQRLLYVDARTFRRSSPFITFVIIKVCLYRAL